MPTDQLNRRLALYDRNASCATEAIEESQEGQIGESDPDPGCAGAKTPIPELAFRYESLVSQSSVLPVRLLPQESCSPAPYLVKQSMLEPSRTRVEMARCFHDRREALSLIHSAHVRAGLPSKSENALRVTRHQLLPRSRIFIAKLDGKVVSTLSLIPDSPAGLPLDDLYREPMDQLRGRGLRIAEVGCFADRRQERGKVMRNFCALLRFIAQYAVAQGIDGLVIDGLVIAGHPRRGRFLKNYLGFRDEGTGIAVAHKESAAVPLWLEFDRLQAEAPDKHHAYFGQSVPAKDFAGGFMPRWEADYFGRPSALDGGFPVALPPVVSPACNPPHAVLARSL